MLGRVELTNKLVASKSKIDEKDVTSVMNFFYTELREVIEGCKHPYVYVRGLGTFSIKRAALNKRLFRLYRAKQARGKDPQGGQLKALETIRTEMFTLFDVRRMLKNRVKINKKLKEDGKVIRDNKR